MGHAFLTPKSMAVLAAYTGFFYFLSLSHKGPWHGKWDLGTIAKERTKDIGPEFASQFKPETHPALKQNQH